jgi:hypothetical protein
MRWLISFQLAVAGQKLMKSLKMKRREMVKSVIKVFLIVGVFMFAEFFSSKGFTQVRIELCEEEHKIIDSSFKKSTKESIQIYYQTIGFESWMELIWDKDNRREDGIGLCVFDDPEMERAFEKLRGLVGDLLVKSLVKEKLGKRYKLVKNTRKDNFLFLSEPITIGNYSFLFRKSKSTKSLLVQERSLENDWNPKCVVTLYGELH